jgi:putative FmdB family regulatory protein
MPIYEYSCAACGHVFEKLIRNPAEIPNTCPACGKEPLKKLFSSFAAQVAGTRCKQMESCPSSAAHRHSGGCCGTGACPHAPPR